MSHRLRLNYLFLIPYYRPFLFLIFSYLMFKKYT
nr:MAG TPA: hypothetical protein [Caudoviricetes sp.]